MENKVTGLKNESKERLESSTMHQTEIQELMNTNTINVEKYETQITQIIKDAAKDQEMALKKQEETLELQMKGMVQLHEEAVLTSMEKGKMMAAM